MLMCACAVFVCTLVTLSQNSSSTKPNWSGTVPESFLSQMDWRFAALSKAPELLARLDQKKAFYDDEEYNDTRDVSLSHAAMVLTTAPEPKDFTSIAVCLADSRVFFTKEQSELAIVGWTPLLQQPLQPKQRQLAILIVPAARGTKGKFLDTWRSKSVKNVKEAKLSLTSKTGVGCVSNIENPSAWGEWVRTLAVQSVGLKLKAPLIVTKDEDILFVRAGAEIGEHDYKRSFDVRVFVSQHAVCIKTMLLPSTWGWKSPRGRVRVIRSSPGGILRSSDDGLSPLPFWPPRK